MLCNGRGRIHAANANDHDSGDEREQARLDEAIDPQTSSQAAIKIPLFPKWQHGAVTVAVQCQGRETILVQH